MQEAHALIFVIDASIPPSSPHSRLAEARAELGRFFFAPHFALPHEPVTLAYNFGPGHSSLDIKDNTANISEKVPPPLLHFPYNSKVVECR